MAVDFKALNRQQDMTVQQKAALKKIFLALEQAAINGNPDLASRTMIHTYMAGHFSGDERHDIQALAAAIRAGIVAMDNTINIDSVVGSFRMGGNQRRVLRIMADAVVFQIST